MQYFDCAHIRHSNRIMTSSKANGILNPWRSAREVVKAGLAMLNLQRACDSLYFCVLYQPT